MPPSDSTALRLAPAAVPAYRTAPHNIEAEQSLLGAILVNNDAFYRVSDFLLPQHFFEPLHQHLYEIAGSLIRMNKIATPVTLKTFVPADTDIGGMTVPQYLARLAAEAFSSGGDPLNRALGTTFAQFVDFVELLRDKFEREELTVVAEDSESREIIGVMLNDDMGYPYPDSVANLEWAAPGMALLGELDRQYFKGHIKQPGAYFHFFLLAVSQKTQGQGVAQALVRSALEVAHHKGYQTAVVEATGPISQRVFRKAGFVERVEITYKNFAWQGNYPFTGIEDHPSVVLLDKTLGR